ncbi:hypothetical protein GLOIN_2v1791215 [Rhizophagus irregularis DAOM 181602=DAOM 197198]|uniref:Uncharacterized protein n=1 Tax=Rhizophagus irregularis (strain DAOM 181602 / DAOM 197198 / MUCL 43194) TaxID=747089 RepID=A0A2P4NXI2_RHIID|nr:hypothetical protein GLOIN_2v1791215 [Rhizophagus irregularis DAOM 181602=DAOM 197198]POG57845.1 hypothetical protein GLOIN_2v1791215 [Rhizophagus irregularis DAOM 181602=DAOM 197198]|eukprot:XP_025164711.1 hypothetical protein GLOIN_2v1791215 [Rhizophagus irregularis DAOM 181602=DAOM 197198]
MDPRLKLQYYDDNDYISQSSDNLEDDLLSHIFKKRKTERDDELKSYFREPTISKSTDVLAWWKVNFIVKFNYNNIYY